MLVLTDAATELIRRLADHPDLPSEAGLRIAGPGNGSEALTASAAAGPREGDAVVEQDGARLFVERGAASSLDNKVLDAEVDEGGVVRFRLTIQ